MHAYACTYTCSHMHMLILHGLLHSLHGLVPSSMDSTDSGPNRPVDQYKTRAFLPLSMLLRAVSTLDLNSTHASPLSTRPACLSPSLRESYIESIRHSTRRNFKSLSAPALPLSATGRATSSLKSTTKGSSNQRGYLVGIAHIADHCPALHKAT